MKPTVYVVNKSYHDFSDARRYGPLVYLSEGKMSRYEPNKMAREFSAKLSESTEEDYLLLSGLSMMNLIAGICFVLKHKRLNLLLFKNGRYLQRNLTFNSDEKIITDTEEHLDAHD